MGPHTQAVRHVRRHGGPCDHQEPGRRRGTGKSRLIVHVRIPSALQCAAVQASTGLKRHVYASGAQACLIKLVKRDALAVGRYACLCPLAR